MVEYFYTGHCIMVCVENQFCGECELNTICVLTSRKPVVYAKLKILLPGKHQKTSTLY